MKILYTSVAKDDLVHIDWKERIRLIKIIEKLPNKQHELDKLDTDEPYPIFKYSTKDYIILTNTTNNAIRIMKILKKRSITIPE